VVACTCGHETEAHPATGVLSFLDGRKRQLHLTGRCMVAPSLAAFIAAQHIRHHQSRRKIREFLLTWLGVPLSVGSIDRCIREAGVACEPIVEDLPEEVRAAGIIHADETPWYQGILNRWLRVILTATTAVFHIGSRRHEEIRDLPGDAMIPSSLNDDSLRPPSDAGRFASANLGFARMDARGRSRGPHRRTERMGHSFGSTV
jgi:hypothetical protein